MKLKSIFALICALFLPIGVRSQALAFPSLPSGSETVDPNNEGTAIYAVHDFGKPLVEFRAAHESRWTFESRNGLLEIQAATYKNPRSKGDIIFVTGVMDSFARNLETIYDLYNLGYSVHTYDHRGQGLSPRLAPNPQVIHVSNFDHYSDDFSDFVAAVRPDLQSERKKTGDLFMVTVSMGALIGAKYIAAHPGQFDAAVYGAPMFKIYLQNFLGRIVARPLLDQMCRFGRCTSYVPGGSDYDPEKYSLKHNPFTSDKTRFDFLIDFIENVDAMHVGWPSAGWLRNSLQASEDFILKYKDHTAPSLVLTAENDGLTLASGATQFCSEALSCMIIPLQNARHDVWNESDFTRKTLLHETALHLAAHSSTPSFGN